MGSLGSKGILDGDQNKVIKGEEEGTGTLFRCGSRDDGEQKITKIATYHQCEGKAQIRHECVVREKAK